MRVFLLLGQLICRLCNNPGWSVNCLMQLKIAMQIRQYHQDGEEVQQEFSLGTFSPDQSTQHQVLHDEGVLDGRPYLQQVTLLPLSPSVPLLACCFGVGLDSKLYSHKI